MPKSFTELKPKLAVTVTVTKKVILVEGDAIAPINAGRVDPAVKRDGENGYYITPLVDILEKHARREKKVAEMTGQKFEAQLMLVADQTTPYRLLTEVIYSCGQAGYANYRLLVSARPRAINGPLTAPVPFTAPGVWFKQPARCVELVCPLS